MPTDCRRFPLWLWYALLCIFWWGLWGFLSKIGSEGAGPLQMQILVTLGMLPVALGMLVDAGAGAVGVNCEQEPDRILAITREMRKAVTVPIAAQPAAFRTTDSTSCFTCLPQFPDEMEAIQLPRSAFEQFAQRAKSEGIQYLGGCCGCNAAYIQAFASGMAG
jgi:methionine synthase I (cobalamin-dependent)